MNRLIAFNELKAVPEYTLELPLEFTFVDYLSEAIIKSIEYYNNSVSILHIYNPNHILVKDLISYLNTDIKTISKDDFSRLIRKTLNNPIKKDIISFITNDMDKNYNLVYITDIKLKNDFTTKFLEKAGFTWPSPTETYIKKIKQII